MLNINIALYLFRKHHPTNNLSDFHILEST